MPSVAPKISFHLWKMLVVNDTYSFTAFGLCPGPGVLSGLFYVLCPAGKESYAKPIMQRTGFWNYRKLHVTLVVHLRLHMTCSFQTARRAD